ncbi:MAG: hypothetical protein UU16_C0029G0004 [Candidatus Woesebacteria bacterium GW2011_GWA2_40_7]|uniref:Uncharacterized protein n=3 Tax=Candidatus Woeseibacteriota TaxID=1752722 RepID=A0A0G0P268_9BACT|nr:MAG: hypothetical protein UT17_C0003G0207 [Candidatus Woesebacteria bacterium GW2011_GWB1_39_10]KKR73149.1 MAG: hypothetical protein UU16_C0029G0004 [Candidatus Woesebacteria bacterium GW2011_GWA2_40_7]KKS91144.1 MAG: hypothetical protein UV66_C0001G0501 [Candidatus Woesebacteria bacterium GW2011_GWA1_43_12]
MPDGMSPEKTSIDATRNFGAIQGHENPKIPQPFGISESSARMLKEHNKLWEAQAVNIPQTALVEHKIVNLLNPADPNYDPRAEAEMRGMFQERDRHERDPLGLYSAASNYADSMLRYAKLPLVGSAEFDLEVERIATKMARTSGGKKGNPDMNILRNTAIQELTVNEMGMIVELDRNFGMAVGAGNRSVMETLGMLEAFVPPKPFEANMQERHLSGATEMLEAMALYHRGKIPERLAGWYRVYDAVNEQQRALFNILCAAGGGMEGYYDALKQAGESLISRARYHANAHDFRAAYTMDDPGVSTNELSAGERAHIKDTLASTEIKELQVEMLSQARRLIMFNVDAAQVDVDKPVGKDGLMTESDEVINRYIQKLRKKADAFRDAGDEEGALRVEKHLPSVENVKNLNISSHREFMKLVFGELDKSKWVTWKSPDSKRDITTPREILTWYGSSDKLGEREVWLSKMLAVLTWKDASGKGISDFLQTASDAQILALAKEIVQRSFKIRNNIGDKVMNSDPAFTTAKIALISWIEKDKGFQVSGSLAWINKYGDFIAGKKLTEIVRMYDAGGLYKSYDSVNLWAYWRRWATYKAGWKSATQFFGPASDAWRRDVAKHGPDWLPPLDRLRKNKKISKLHDRFFTDGDTASGDDKVNFLLWRAKRLTGNNKLSLAEMNTLIAGGKLKTPSIDKTFINKLLEVGWTMESAWGDVPIPMYMPKNFKINVFEMMVDKSTGDTVWDLMRVGIMPKDIDWDAYNYETLDRMWVSMSMLVRFAHLFIDPYEAQRDPSYIGFFGEPSPQSIAEMSKRVYLAFRDLPEGYQQYIVAIVPFMIAQNTASAVGLTSPELGSGNKEKVMKQWNLMMAQWKRAAMWMPQVILDDEQLYNGKAADIQSLRNDIALMIEYYQHVFEKLGQAAFKADKGKLASYYADQLGLYKESLAEEMAADPGEASLDFGAAKIIESFTGGEKAVMAALFGEKR